VEVKLTDTRKPGRKIILVVDDTPAIRKMICQILARHGYTVLEAADGREALEVSEAHNHGIHLLLTDIIMPRMNGGELAEHLRRINPRLPMIFMSGYTSDGFGPRPARATSFLAKPFTPHELTRTVREVLDSG
jgi:two-component system cell cycle sensor histidine kinase/response regulator CckA